MNPAMLTISFVRVMVCISHSTIARAKAIHGGVGESSLPRKHSLAGATPRLRRPLLPQSTKLTCNTCLMMRRLPLSFAVSKGALFGRTTGIVVWRSIGSWPSTSNAMGSLQRFGRCQAWRALSFDCVQRMRCGCCPRSEVRHGRAGWTVGSGMRWLRAWILSSTILARRLCWTRILRMRAAQGRHRPNRGHS